MDFHYKKIPVIDIRTGRVLDTVYRPIIKIGIKKEVVGKEFLDYEVLIDSGADDCILPTELADIAGVDLAGTEVKKFYGIGGGTAVGYRKNITVSLGGYLFPITTYFSPEIRGYGILGQRGFFEKFRVRFVYSTKKIEITAEKPS